MYMLIQHALVYPEEMDELHSDLSMFISPIRLSHDLCLDSPVGAVFG